MRLCPNRSLEIIMGCLIDTSLLKSSRGMLLQRKSPWQVVNTRFARTFLRPLPSSSLQGSTDIWPWLSAILLPGVVGFKMNQSLKIMQWLKQKRPHNPTTTIRRNESDAQFHSSISVETNENVDDFIVATVLQRTQRLNWDSHKCGFYISLYFVPSYCTILWCSAFKKRCMKEIFFFNKLVLPKVWNWQCLLFRK